LAKVVGALMTNAAGGPLLSAICVTASQITESAGAGLSLHSNGSRGSTCSHGFGAQAGEDSQVLLGVGPGLDAFAAGALVEEPHLGAATSTRWPAFDLSMLAVGIRAVSSFPLQFGAARFGVLILYASRAGPMTRDQTADGYVIAQIAAYAVVGSQAGMSDDLLAPVFENGFASVARVHQATGILMARLGIRAEEALVRLRAVAFRAGPPLGAMAADIVAGRFEYESEGEH